MSESIRIARVILNLGVVPAFIRDEAPKLRWHAHKRAVNKTFRDNPGEYVDRMRRVARHASKKGCRVIMFPACAFVHDSGIRIDDYLDATKGVRWVLAGTYRPDSTPGGMEAALVAKNGRKLVHFDSSRVHWLQLDRFSAMTAISSTIAKARDVDPTPVDERPPQESSPVLLLDMGHHQYGGHYVLTLRSVTNSISEKTGSPATTILAYWKYLQTRPKSPWVFGIGREFEPDRYPLSLEDGGGDDLVDIVDVTAGGRKEGTMIPKEIGKEHVRKAIRQIDREGVPRRRHSTKYDLIHEGRTHPPKYVLSLAAEFATGKGLLPNQFSGGSETNHFLERLGFKIRQFRKR